MTDPQEPQGSAERVTEAGRALIRLGSRLHRLYAETIESLSIPLSVQQYRILDRVGLGISSLSQLAELARRQPPTISKSVDSLVRQGLLTRSEAATDRRATALSLTPAGAALLREAHDALDRLGRWLIEAAAADPESLAAFAVGLYDKTETELDLLVGARRMPRRTPRLARSSGTRSSGALWGFGYSWVIWCFALTGLRRPGFPLTHLLIPARGIPGKRKP